MTSSAWKSVERMVAGLLGGVRSWQTDHDVLLITDDKGLYVDPEANGDALLTLSRMGLIELSSVEVKNLTGPTVAQLEGYLAKNARKMARDGITGQNALVIKRRPGRGHSSPYLLVVPLEVPPYES